MNRAIQHILSEPNANAPRPLAFSVLRVPFFLEPHYDESRTFIESNRERLVKKWGGRQGWESQKKRHDLKGRGQAAGIPHFNLDRLAANSMASHRLIQHLGKTYGLDISEAIYDVLNEYYFVDGYSLNDRPRLATTVAEALTRILPPTKAPTSDALLTFLNGTEGRAEIKRALMALDELGVHGIPKFIVEGTTVVDGAAHADVFVNIFREIELRGSLKGSAVFADILGVSPETIERGSHRPQHMTV